MSYQVIDAYGSVISIQSSVFGSDHRQIVGGTYNLTRNDNVASTISANLNTGVIAGDSAGRLVFKPFAPDESTFRFVTSVVSGSVTLIQASVIGKRSYITDLIVANTGSVFGLVTIQDGSTSILGYIPAPTTGGAVPVGFAIPIRTNPSQDLSFKVSPSASILYLTVNGYQAP